MRAILLALLLTAASFAADITGAWSAEVQTDMGTGNPTFTFTQDGDKLTGTYSGQLGDAKLTGTIKGNQVEWTYEVSPQGDKLVVKYAGTVEGGTKMKGTVELGTLAKGTFTAAKK